MLVMAASPHCSPRTDTMQRSQSLLFGGFGILTHSNDVTVLQSERGLYKTSGCFSCRSQSGTSGRHRSPEKARREVRLHHVSLMGSEQVLLAGGFIVPGRSD